LRVSKPVIAVDIDNTIAATDIILRELIKVNYGLTVRQSDITDWHYYNCLPISKEDEEFILEEYHKKYISLVPLIADAKESLENITKKYTIWIITARPSYTRSETLLWLKKHEITYNRIIFSKRKGKYINAVNILIDDNKFTANEYASAGVKVIILDYPWNRKLEANNNVIRAKDWRNILNIITSNSPETS
jgi:uncharacterized HAD superfamily protein